MKKEIYKSYADNVKDLLANGRRRGNLTKAEGFSSFNGDVSERRFSQLTSENMDISLFNSLNDLTRSPGKKAKYHEKPGQHPDFMHLKSSDNLEHHYITSMFIDIKNSTGLFRKYEPDAVARITTAIQKVAIHTCWYFDGYIQRFHGDGLLVYFGGKNMTLQTSVDNAVNAASYFSYFMKYGLDSVFTEYSVDKLYTRIGIDVGPASEVVWHVAGLKDCSEITTCSLHTSLAAKMQVKAESNGIMVGGNIKNDTIADESLFTITYDKDGVEDRYIFRIPEEGFNYTQWKFNWEKYLSTKPLVERGYDGKLYSNSDSTPQFTDSNSLNKGFLTSQIDGYRPYYDGQKDFEEVGS